MMKPNAFRTFLALGFMAATLSANLSFAQQTPKIPSTPPMQPSTNDSGNPGGSGNTDPCGTVPCAVAVH
jgi:hypothetical protein